ncbi:thiopeptide-type bacteriocin biosynthesis protein [Longispora sp. NPDC051575]|uniref:thiopeptide-type bacteriocin biosynthesis protein n=1 Tax=Longispora sp. NPDC051575 TaxID=3154943 RepID=UPI00344281D9
MLADRLTLPADVLAVHVEAVLAGRPAEQIAAGARIEPGDLADAVEAYRAAGLAALHARQDKAWFNARVQVADWADAESAFATVIGPLLDQLPGSPGWWYLRKYPCWRIRIRTDRHQEVRAVLDDLVDQHVVAAWTPGVYEPEDVAFGGPAGTAAVHGLFCADSANVLAYSRLDPPPIGRRELSLILIRTLQDHAGLDPFEAGDVFARLARSRPAPVGEQRQQIDDLATRMLPLLTLDPQYRAQLFAPAGALHVAAAWRGAFETAGRQLGEAATAGHLDRGLRAILAQLVIFHWNRLHLTAAAQGVLARAATAALLPPG